MNQIIRALLLSVVVIGTASGQSPVLTPVTWGASGALEDFVVARDSLVAHSGRMSIRFIAEDAPASFAGIATSMPASPYEGRRVRVSAYLRTAQLGGNGAAVWARADGGSFAFTTSAQAPVLGTTEWTAVEVTLDVPRGARTVVAGVYSFGKGTLWIDDVRIAADSVPTRDASFEEPGAFQAPRPTTLARSLREPARALSARGIQNLTALTRLLGDVRFFHPAQEAVRVNWDEFAVRTVRAVEGALDAESLASSLRTMFAPVAPQVAIYRSSDAAPAAPTAPSPGAGVIYWQHLGVGAPSGGVAPSSQQNIYRSTRVLVPGSAVGSPIVLRSGRFVAGEKTPCRSRSSTSTAARTRRRRFCEPARGAVHQ